MSSKNRVLIIDDDTKSIEKLSEILSDYPDLEVVGNATSCKKGKGMVAEIKPDLLFLDIELPDGNGLENINAIKQSSPETYVVLFTAYYRKHNDDIFQDDDSDCLLKPIDELELNKVIKRYRRHRLLSQSGKMQASSLITGRQQREEVFTATTYTNELRVMRLADIGYFRYSMRRKVWEVALNDHSFVQLKRGTTANDILQYSAQFVQTHQSYIVNTHYLLLVGPSKCRLFPPFEEDIPIGRTYSRELRNHFQEI